MQGGSRGVFSLPLAERFYRYDRTTSPFSMRMSLTSSGSLICLLDLLLGAGGGLRVGLDQWRRFFVHDQQEAHDRCGVCRPADNPEGRAPSGLWGLRGERVLVHGLPAKRTHLLKVAAGP